MPDMVSDKLSPLFFYSLDKSQSHLCILEEGSSQQQSNIPIGLAKYQDNALQR